MNYITSILDTIVGMDIKSNVIILLPLNEQILMPYYKLEHLWFDTFWIIKPFQKCLDVARNWTNGRPRLRDINNARLRSNHGHRFHEIVDTIYFYIKEVYESSGISENTMQIIVDSYVAYNLEEDKAPSADLFFSELVDANKNKLGFLDKVLIGIGLIGGFAIGVPILKNYLLKKRKKGD